MKKISILSLMFIWSGLLTGQYVVIDSTNLGGISIPFQDTTISSIDTSSASCITTNYFVDLDQDTIEDVKFVVDCYMGGQGSYYRMMITTFNDFTVHVDTNYQEHAQYLDTGTWPWQVHDTIRTTTVIKRYVWGDTIYYNGPTAINKYMLHLSYAYEFPCVCNNINLFLGYTSYVAFTKSDGYTSSIYYLKVAMPTNTRLRLISAKTDDPSSNINENFTPHVKIFPNPVYENINFSKGSYDFVEIYTLHGTLILSESVSKTQDILNISWIPNGYYIIKFKNKYSVVATRFIKL